MGRCGLPSPSPGSPSQSPLFFIHKTVGFLVTLPSGERCPPLGVISPGIWSPFAEGVYVFLFSLLRCIMRLPSWNPIPPFFPGNWSWVSYAHLLLSRKFLSNPFFPPPQRNFKFSPPELFSLPKDGDIDPPLWCRRAPSLFLLFPP